MRYEEWVENRIKAIENILYLTPEEKEKEIDYIKTMKREWRSKINYWSLQMYGKKNKAELSKEQLYNIFSEIFKSLWGIYVGSKMMNKDEFKEVFKQIFEPEFKLIK